MNRPNLESVMQSKQDKTINLVDAAIAKRASSVIPHNDVFARTMVAADKITQQTKGSFFHLWAAKEDLPLAYIFFSYHQNCMIVEKPEDADLIIEVYEQDEKPSIEGAKETVAYLALFKQEEGLMPWL